MSIVAGDWVGLPDGSVARVVEIGRDGAHEMVLAETPSGTVHERPLAYAIRSWTTLDPVGLRVRFATKPEEVRTIAREDPIAIVAAALLDADGTASSDELQTAIALVIPVDDLRTWWKRIQRRLETDERIDTSQALERRYRLVRPGERKLERRRARRSGRCRGGRELLDGPTLLDARERAKSKDAISETDRADLLAEAALALDVSVDPTDRFLAGELGVMLGETTEAQLRATLGEDVLSIDLLRIREFNSRDRAVRLAVHVKAAGGEPTETAVESVRLTGPTIWSAIAAGGRWAEPVLAALEASGSGRRASIARALTWSIPGSDEAGDINYPRDLETYRKRLEPLGDLAERNRDASNETIASACLEGLLRFEAVPQHGTEWTSVATTLSNAMWRVCRDDPGAFRSAAANAPPLSADSWLVIVESAPSELLPAVTRVAEDAYARRPELLRAYLALAERRGLDPVAAMLDVARRVVRDTTAPRIAVDALHQSLGVRGSARESVTLAGTIWPDHPDVIARMQSLRDVAMQEVATGTGDMGPVLLDRKAWNATVGVVREELTESRRRVEAADGRAREAETKAAQLEESLERRRETIQEVQAQRSTDQGTSAHRMATSLFKPIAAALADSYEGNSLAALQDLLMASLARAHIVAIAEPGDIVDFDPEFHVWVGDGYPGARVRVLTPGFMTRREDPDVVVLTPARVDDPESDR